MSLSEEKKALRKEISNRLSIYDQEYLQKDTECALNKLEQEKAFLTAKCVLLYWSLPDEIYTHEFIEKWAKEKTILLPVIKDNLFEVYVYSGKENMEIGPYNIMQPNTQRYEGAIDLAIIPGRAFDFKGHRLGRGKGFYDFFLKDFTGISIGLCFNFQLIDYIPHESFDIQVNKIITSEVSTHLF